MVQMDTSGASELDYAEGMEGILYIAEAVQMLDPWVKA